MFFTELAKGRKVMRRLRGLGVGLNSCGCRSLVCIKKMSSELNTIRVNLPAWSRNQGQGRRPGPGYYMLPLGSAGLGTCEEKT